MKWISASLTLTLAVVTASATAQPTVDYGRGDPRILRIAFDSSKAAEIQTSTETVQTILLAPGEQIRSIMLSNPNAYQVVVAGSGDGITLRAMSPISTAAMRIQTEQRQYEIKLANAADTKSPVPVIVAFDFGATPSTRLASPPPLPVLLPEIRYQFSGSKALRPVMMGDDGRKTYISWADNQPIPAVFAINPSGAEETVDGYFRAGIFTIDRVYDRLVFRIDKEATKASRLTSGKAASHD